MQAVIDTNVLFEGLTTGDSACGLIVDAWLEGVFTPSVSESMALEYEAVLSRELSPRRWLEIQPVLGVLLQQARFVPVHFLWRPASQDKGDDKVIDCAMNANAAVVTLNVRDFRQARRELGLTVWSPREFIDHLADELTME